MPRNLSDSFFGSIALKNKMLTRDQLTRALRVQWDGTRDGVGPTLGEVCRILGFLSDEEVNAVLWAQAKSEVMLEDSLMGKICIANKLLTRKQLDEALEDQRALDFTVRLGDLLCQKGYLDRQQLNAVLKAQDRIKSRRLKPVIMPPVNARSGGEGWAPTSGKPGGKGAGAEAAAGRKSPGVPAERSGAGLGAATKQLPKPGKVKARGPVARSTPRSTVATPAEDRSGKPTSGARARRRK